MRHKTMKKALSLLLVLSMTLGVMSTTAFAADPDDYVYVYINVEKDEVQTSAPEKPNFDQDKKAIEEEQKKVEDAKGAVDTAASNLGDIPVFEAPTNDQNPEGKTDLDMATDAVNSALDALTGADKPEYKEATDTPDPDAQTGDGQTTGTDTPGESEGKSFTETVNDTVKGLNDAIDPTEQAVEDGKADADAAAKVTVDGTDSTLAAEKAKLDAVAKKALDALTQDRNKADAAVKEANELTAALSGQKEALQSELNGKIEELKKPVAPTAPTAPAVPSRASYDTYEAYETAYKAYETAYKEYETAYETYKTDFSKYEGDVVVYEGQVADLKAEYDGKLTDLTNAAGDAVEKAKADLKAAEEALAAFNAIKDQYGKGTEEVPGLDVAAKSKIIQKYNDALKAYNDAVANYNGKADSYNGAAGEYNNAVKEYDEAVGEYNDKVGKLEDSGKLGTYNGKVNDYNEQVKAYDEKVDLYNGKVDDYNGKVDTFNDGQIEAAKEAMNKGSSNQYADDLQKALEALESDITVTKTNEDGSTTTQEVSGTDMSAWAGLSDEDYNLVVDVYNTRVAAYNRVLTGDPKDENGERAYIGYNEQLVDDKLAQVDAYFGKNPGEGTHEANGQNWYTVGKINVSGIFNGKPGNVQSNNLTGTDEDGNPLYDYNAPNKTDKKYQGHDIYHFTNMATDENGNVTAKVERPETLKTEDGLYANGKDQEDLLNALAAKNLDRWSGNSEVNLNAGFDPTTDINRWVLKVSNGANDYQYRYKDENGSWVYTQDKPEGGQWEQFTGYKVTFHLDGYLRVQQLATLATLEKRIVNNYEKKDTIEQKDMIGEYDGEGNLLNGLDTANSYNVYQAVMGPNSNPEPVDPKPEWTGGEVNGRDESLAITRPDAMQPGEITDKTPNPGITIPTPTPTPITPTTPTTPTGGGGGGDGDGDGETTITEDPTPLAETPEEVEIPPEEVPLAEEPEEEPEEVEIPEEDVPLADVPKTGDISAVWYFFALLSAAGLLVLTVEERKERRTNR